jgi:hypothetical protein
MTRHELFRKRIAPILFFCVLALIAYDAWQKDKHEGITGTVVIELGEARPRVREVEAEMFVRGESVSVFRRAALPDARIGECRFEARMPAPDGELRIAVDLGGERRQLARAVHIEDGAAVRVDLGPELGGPAR